MSVSLGGLRRSEIRILLALKMLRERRCHHRGRVCKRQVRASLSLAEDLEGAVREGPFLRRTQKKQNASVRKHAAADASVALHESRSWEFKLKHGSRRAARNLKALPPQHRSANTAAGDEARGQGGLNRRQRQRGTGGKDRKKGVP